MDFLSDYELYHKPYCFHRNYVAFNAFGLISAIMHRKLVYMHGTMEIPPMIYVLNIGPQGNGKSEPLRFSKKFFVAVAPDLEIGASTQTSADIVKTMADDKFARVFTNWRGESIEVRPLVFFISEFKDFIAYNPIHMLNFLGNIYDENPYKSSLIKRGVEYILNPAVTITACENTEQLVKFMKTDVFSGGLSRRFIIVNEPTYPKRSAFIEESVSADETLWLKLKQRLVDIRKLTGQYKWDPAAKSTYEKWFNDRQRDLEKETNALMKGYLSTAHVQLWKLMMLAGAVSDNPMFLFTKDLLDMCSAHLLVLEPKMRLINLASSRNETMDGQRKLIDLLDANDGKMPEKQLRRTMEGEFRNPMELLSVIKNLEDTDRVVKKQMKEPNGSGVDVIRWFVITKSRWDKGVKSGEFKIQQKEHNQ